MILYMFCNMNTPCRYVGCETEGSARGNHVGWTWPGEDQWTWCADKYRKKDPRKPPTVPRGAGALATAAPLASVAGPPPPAAKPTVGAALPLESEEPAAPQLAKSRRRLPASFQDPMPVDDDQQPPMPARDAKLVDGRELLKHALPWLAFIDLARAQAASQWLKTLVGMEFDFVEFQFEQADFPWTWHKSKKEAVRVHSQCTFIASLAAVAFYENPALLHASWRMPELWQEFHEQGRELHMRYTKACVLSAGNSLVAALGADAFFCTPVEYASRFGVLLARYPKSFSSLRSLFAERSLMTLHDSCTQCDRVGHAVSLSGEARCATCGARTAAKEMHMADCFKAIRKHVAECGQGHAYIIVVGSRTFFLCVSDDVCVAHDSHKRSWSGRPANGSSCITATARWREGGGLDVISEIWSRGELGYSSVDRAGLWTWGAAGSGTPDAPQFADADEGDVFEATASPPDAAAAPAVDASSMGSLTRGKMEFDSLAPDSEAAPARLSSLAAEAQACAVWITSTTAAADSSTAAAVAPAPLVALDTPLKDSVVAPESLAATAEVAIDPLAPPAAPPASPAADASAAPSGTQLAPMTDAAASQVAVVEEHHVRIYL